MLSVFERFVLVLFCGVMLLFKLFYILSDEPRQNQGRGLVDHKPVKVPQ